MKLITWNCNMAFRKKAGLVLAYKPDILVIPECEHPDKLQFGAGIPLPKDRLWFGSNPHKGLGIFSYSKYRFQVCDNHNEQLRLVVPILVTGGSIAFHLLAIWANNPADPDGPYVDQVWKAIHHYEDLLQGPVILAGDFNSNSVWDRKRRISNHSNVVAALQVRGIESSYHRFHRQAQGAEVHPTHYLYRHKNKPYHLDYCFLSADMVGRIKSVEVGAHRKWARYSDHVPIIVTLVERRSKR